MSRISAPLERRGALLGAAAACLLVTSCGSHLSTEQLRAGNAVDGQPSTSHDNSASAGNGSTDTSSGTGGGAANVGATASGVAGPSRGATRASIAPGSAVTGGRSGTTGTGVTSSAQVSGGGTAVGEAVKCAKSGPPIKIGQVGTWSGLVGAANGVAKPALAVWAKYENDHGGVACHPIQLTSIDDQSDPSRSEAAAKSLVSDTKVSAIVATYTPIAINGYLQGVDGSGVPTVGGDGADPVWTNNRNLWMVGAGIDQQFYLGAKQEAINGYKKVAVLYCIEASACVNAGNSIGGNGPLSAKAAGQTVVYKATVSLTQSDFTAQCQGAKNAGADNVFAAFEAGTLTRFTQSCDGIGYHPKIYTVGIATTFDVNNPTLKKFEVTIGNPVVPFTQTSDNAAEAVYAAAFQKYAPGITHNHIIGQVWADGMMLQRALEMLGPAAQTQQITPAMVLKGLGSIRNETLGGLVSSTTYTFGESRSVANRCGTTVKYTAGRWTAVNRSTFICAPA
jgi:ABC-type branched-subunit amino acid transport system substrate-binding protein